MEAGRAEAGRTGASPARTGMREMPAAAPSGDVPSDALQRVSVRELDRMLVEIANLPDAQMSERLATLELTERLSAGPLADMIARLRGRESQRVLAALAAASAFSDPPAEDIPAMAEPDRAARREILSRAIEHSSALTASPPSYAAHRTLVRFDDAGRNRGGEGCGWRVTGVDSGAVQVRRGKPSEWMRRTAAGVDESLDVSGADVSILGTVFLDAMDARNRFEWSRWESGPAGPLAVFRFAIREDTSHYRVEYCCIADGRAVRIFRATPAYHGEMAIDPASGAVLRVTMIADLKPGDPMAASNLMVEFAPVAINGKTSMCLTKTISVSRVRLGATLREGPDATQDAPERTMLSESTFDSFRPL